MGLHAGHAEARGGDFFGPALNRTARLTAAGHGGQLLLSQGLQQTLGSVLSAGLTLRDLGEHRLKDLRHAERIWQVVAEGLPDVTRPLTTAGELGARDRIVVLDPTAADREGGDEPTVVTRTVGETLAALRQVIMRDAPTVTLTTDQVRQAAAHRSADIAEYRLGRVAEWSQPRYRLDGRFVALTLLVDQGEEAASGRWAARQERYDDLGRLITAVPEPAVVVLGPPGSGKSTLLRHLELDVAISGLRGGGDGAGARDPVTFFRPGVRELLETPPPSETLPALPTTGWEETTVLAAAMTADPAGFVRGVMATNLALAGRCAAQPMVAARLPAELVDGLRWALVARSRDASADLRARMDAGLALGRLGDPRFERRVGPYGAYLAPPMVEIPGGVYPIGEDEPIFDPVTGEDDRAHMPRHTVAIAGFAIGQFPVTNAEYACFMAAGGYDDERWWDTEAGQAWRRGESTAEGRKQGVRDNLRATKANPRFLEDWHDSGSIDDDVYERWLRRMAMTPDQFEAHLAELYPGGRETEPLYWQDQRYNNPGQPVVGISWYEARAFAAWLTAQAGQAFRLPTEAEWEAAARGTEARCFAYGDAFDAERGNMLETHIRRSTPVGIFALGDTPDGISDLAGNVTVWTSSLWGEGAEAPDWKYPYDAADGREEPGTAPNVRRVVRGGSWSSPSFLARAACRYGLIPDGRDDALGVRLASSAPISGRH